MTILITGVAGFIGMHCAARLLQMGEVVVGLDNLNNYYDVTLKEARLRELKGRGDFTFLRGDITDAEAVSRAFKTHRVNRVLNLAAQAGVRYSLENPHAYVASNVAGHLTILEACRRNDTFEHLVYASSSSVYGGNTHLPFSVADRVDNPMSLYAATKKSGELISACYSHLFGLRQTGLRFFTVYGPWGRPDMAAFIFTRAIIEGRPIQVFNYGRMKRDFTFIDDIVDGVVNAINAKTASEGSLHRVYNLGNHRSEALTDFISLIEESLGRKAEIDLQPMQPGDVPETFADIEDSRRDLRFFPKITIRDGIPRFVEWFRNYYRV